jgi:hypothetical protein
VSLVWRQLTGVRLEHPVRLDDIGPTMSGYAGP